MKPGQLGESTMDPAVWRLQIDGAIAAAQLFTILKEVRLGRAATSVSQMGCVRGAMIFKDVKSRMAKAAFLYLN